MFITIHCLGTPFNGETIKTSSLGGSETAAYYLAKGLVEKGHKVTVFTNVQEPSEQEGVKYLPLGQVTEQAPLGYDFHDYSMHTPVDVLIIQRHPLAFAFNWASKVNLWWVHDLATYSQKDLIQNQLWNIDKIMTVSAWHKEQFVKVYGLNPDIIEPVKNGVDLELYKGDYTGLTGLIYWDIDQNKINLLYESRPERGLENLVRPDGIMERLAKISDKFHLYVCSYDNVTEHMAGYYSWLNNRCGELPNVSRLGNLMKDQLAVVQQQCQAMVYPSAFEETSCITAMECMAAGLPLLASKVGALPETTKGAGVILIPTVPNDEYYNGKELRVDGKVDIDKFVKRIKDTFLGNSKLLEQLKETQLACASNYDWSVAVEKIDSVIMSCFTGAQVTAKELHFLHNSDIYALTAMLYPLDKIMQKDLIHKSVKNELNECYAFMDEDSWSDHYAKIYENEEAKGIEYGPESLDGNNRFEYVNSIISALDDGSVVLDYGCAHGHYTINLAKRNSQKKFYGVDICQTNIDKAEKWAKDEGVENVEFFQGEYESLDLSLVDCIIAAEVLEHMRYPNECIDTLSSYLKPGGKFITTTPYGPWEAMGYLKEWPWRAHVHHFERQDLHDLYGYYPDFKITVAPSGHTLEGEAIGSYICEFGAIVPDAPIRVIDYVRKVSETAPRQTVSLCMIVKNAENTIVKCLSSIKDYVDEIIIGVDESTTDNTKQAIEGIQYNRPITVLSVPKASDEGFSHIRNLTIEKAEGVWILWLDDDEVISYPERIHKYLKNNQYNGYAIAQHHFTLEPAGLSKTDFPVRLFRNHKGIKFDGLVHEHPELKKNEGVGHAINIPDVCIGHNGYVNEQIRRKRFERNIGLMMRDRDENPDRVLGKFLWLRDLSQIVGFNLEQTQGLVTQDMVEKAKEGIKIFEELLNREDTTRFIIEGLEFYSRLSQLLPGGFDYTITLKGKKIVAHFHDINHLKKITSILIKETTPPQDRKYA